MGINMWRSSHKLGHGQKKSEKKIRVRERVEGSLVSSKHIIFRQIAPVWALAFMHLMQLHVLCVFQLCSRIT